MFYPGDSDELREEVKGDMDHAFSVADKKVKFIISPHAGYTYSGKVAGQVFAEVKAHFYDHIILLGPSHRHWFSGLVQSGDENWETPMGISPIRNLSSAGIESISRYHADEHCLEVQLPFIQYLYDGDISPILVSGKIENAESYADLLEPFDGKNTLWVISSDFNHVGPSFQYNPKDYGYENGKEMDCEAIDLIETGNVEGFLSYLNRNNATICGQIPILIAMILRKRFGLPHFKLKKYDCSSHLTGDLNSVGYAALYC